MCDEALKDGGVIDPISLRSSALGAVTTDTLDYNHDGTPSADEILRALTEDAFDFCTVAKGNQAGRAKPCADGQADALRNAGDALSSFWAQKGTLYDVRFAGTPNDDEAMRMPDLKSRPWALLLDPQGRFEKAVCRPSKTPTTPPVAAAKKPAFLLGKDIDSLTVARPGKGPDSLAKVKSAEISFAADNAVDTRTFAVDAVVGLRVLDTERLKLIPFLQYSRSEVRDRKADTEKLTGKFSAGVVSTFVLGWDQIDIAPLYARDLKTHSELFTGRVAWRPGFLYRFDPFNNAVHFACKPAPTAHCFNNGLALWTDFQVIGSFGTVLGKGDDPTAIVDKDYARIGPSAALHIYGLSGLAENMSFDTSYKRLFTITGGGRPVYSLKADLSYWIAGSNHVAMITGYERSRDEETLELTDKWKLGLGLRF